MRIVVTGASGFAGGAIADRLVAEGHRVIGLGRRPEGWSNPRGRYVREDLLHPGFRPTDCDAVVNAAATTDERASLPQALAANRDLPASLPRLFPGARIIHLSSSSVADVAGRRIGMREDDPPASRWLGTYPASKAAGDRALEGSGAVILRPHAIYGPGDRTLLPRLERIARGGVLPLPGGGRSRHTLTRVEALAEAVALALANDPEPGVYHVADATTTTLAEALGEVIEHRTGVRPRILDVPLSAAMALARTSARLERRTGRGFGDLTPTGIKLLALDCVLDTTLARAAFGYEAPATRLDDAASW